MANGVQGDWLIDGDSKTVYIYRAGQLVDMRQGISEIAGEGPVAGFVLNLNTIWQGL
jgi:Uma2 family endonuclease